MCQKGGIFLYLKNIQGNIFFPGKWFKPETVDMTQALLYLIRILDPVVERDYSVVYFCTRTSSENMISYWWMKEIYSQLPYHYKKNLKGILNQKGTLQCERAERPLTKTIYLS